VNLWDCPSSFCIPETHWEGRGIPSLLKSQTGDDDSSCDHPKLSLSSLSAHGGDASNSMALGVLLHLPRALLHSYSFVATISMAPTTPTTPTSALLGPSSCLQVTPSSLQGPFSLMELVRVSPCSSQCLVSLPRAL
jgi:hypothetical protein